METTTAVPSYRALAASNEDLCEALSPSSSTGAWAAATPSGLLRCDARDRCALERRSLLEHSRTDTPCLSFTSPHHTKRRRGTMPRYLVKGTYSADGVKALIRDGGSGRRREIEKLVTSGGCSVEQVFFALGDTDLYVILQAPDNETAAALSLAANASGAVSVKVTALFTPEELDGAAKQALGLAGPTFD
jgi:uncharacterized protein with GYD domain